MQIILPFQSSKEVKAVRRRENTAVTHVECALTTEVLVLVVWHITRNMMPVKAPITLYHTTDSSTLTFTDQSYISHGFIPPEAVTISKVMSGSS